MHFNVFIELQKPDLGKKEKSLVMMSPVEKQLHYHTLWLNAVIMEYRVM